MKYMLDYNLGWRSPANIKAEKGTIVHKAMELLAKVKLAQQNKQKFIEDDDFGKFLLTELTPDICIELAYQHYSTKTAEMYDWSDTDLKDCRKWLWTALTYNDGMFNPLKQDIVAPETFFDFKIEESWAAYKYKLPDSTYIEGNLGIKGTIDLIVKVADGIYEMVDYKTGKRMDWNTGEEKTYDKLCSDSQLRMYYYAARRLFPDIKQIIVTIFYINDGGAISMCFDESDLDKTEDMLKKRFNLIRNTFRPKRIYPDWKCTKLCYFGQHDLEENKITKEEYKEKSICSKISKELLTLGMDRVIVKRAKSSFNDYGNGGGSSNRDAKKGIK